MLLVKKRAHLAAYERALREAGIPFVSDKRGGLLESLEVSDLIALLTFLITPGDNRALAHVLKCPIFGCSDTDLICLAGRDEATWWLRLQAAALQLAPAATSRSPCQQQMLLLPEPLVRAADLLTGWRSVAPRLPVHDLLDIIFDEGEIVTRYAQAAGPLQRSQVIGNLHAFIELSLSMDAGRYPSLPKFIDALRMLQQSANRDAPDEAAIDTGIDAVRILTIHSAKGLEAPIVVLLDANHSEAAREDAGVLCVWPQHAPAPTHFSAFGRRAERGMARAAYFAEEEALKAQEDWNLLYVATTRARQILIVSGVAGGRGADADGVVADSWYARLASVPQSDHAAVAPVDATAREEAFSLSLYLPPRMPAPAAQIGSGGVDGEGGGGKDETDGGRSAAEQAAAEEGILLHALMERITVGAAWPVPVPPPDVTAGWLGCKRAEALDACAQAACILAAPALRRFFDPGMFDRAHNELELYVDGTLLRLDRVVYFADQTWILDYKRSVASDDLPGYGAQLGRYRSALASAGVAGPVHAALISVDGRLHVIS